MLVFFGFDKFGGRRELHEFFGDATHLHGEPSAFAVGVTFKAVAAAERRAVAAIAVVAVAVAVMFVFAGGFAVGGGVFAVGSRRCRCGCRCGS